jgi:GNAT superfamily N-acetyltransferase
MSRRVDIKNIRLKVESLGYALITDTYVNNKTKMHLICPNKHILNMSYQSFKGYNNRKGHRCPKCTNSGTSRAEKEIFDFVKSFYSDAVGNSHEIIEPYELDIFIPSLNLAIEYCGLYWHSEEYREKNYHLKKMRLCNEKGIRLITIFEDEWLERQDQVKNFLLSAINKNELKVMGRKTEVRVVPKPEAVAFLDDTHIQGSPLFEVAFGLYHNNELVGITTGNKHHRQGHGSLFVLNRLAFKSNISVSGGSSKLLKALLGYAKEKGYSRLISWSDNRWSEGNVYEKTGFELTETLPPDYSYVLREKRISKQSCQKKNLLKKGAVGNTENEMALSLGLYRIWDCGKKRWEIFL